MEYKKRNDQNGKLLKMDKKTRRAQKEITKKVERMIRKKEANDFFDALDKIIKEENKHRRNKNIENIKALIDYENSKVPERE